MKVTMRMSTPQWGETRGSDANSRAGRVTQRSRVGERILRAGVGAGEQTSVGAPVASATSRPKAMAAARSGALGASTG
jgi:hypothetical protein